MTVMIWDRVSYYKTWTTRSLYRASSSMLAAGSWLSGLLDHPSLCLSSLGLLSLAVVIWRVHLDHRGCKLRPRGRHHRMVSVHIGALYLSDLTL